MPQLWAETIAAHRAEVREAILDAAGELLRRRGLLALSMSELAASAGIGRATLYKYFPDVEQVLAAWHERRVAAHLAELAAIGAKPGDSAERLRAVCLAYGRILQQRQQHGDAELSAVLHNRQPTDDSQAQLVAIFVGLITEAAAAGAVRPDVPPGELAAYSLSALEAASAATSQAALARLVDVVWAGLAARQDAG
jgi:AcrR family transcriptional regulator